MVPRSLFILTSKLTFHNVQDLVAPRLHELQLHLRQHHGSLRTITYHVETLHRVLCLHYLAMSLADNLQRPCLAHG